MNSKLFQSLVSGTFICCLHIAFLPVAQGNPIQVKKTSSSVVKSENVHYPQWTEVANFVDQMVVKHQFNKDELNAMFDQVRYVESAIQLMKPAPPGKPKNWQAYRARFVENVRIKAGLAFWDNHTDALIRAENQYGVPAEIIVGLIGVETIYGRTTGNFRVIDALTTLAFSYPDTSNRDARMAFFRSELEQMLLWSRETSTDIFAFKGSYAGAIGWCQFMPSSIRKYAVDFDGDGKIDLRESPIDAIGSIANYLAQFGWKKELPMTFPATLVKTAPDISKLNEILGQGLKATYLFDDIKTTLSTSTKDLPLHIKYGVIDLQNGLEPTEYWLATDNFFAITYYNRSYFYAMSVIDLGKVIKEARSKPQSESIR